MGFFKRWAWILGFGKDDGHDVKDEDGSGDGNRNSEGDTRRERNQPTFQETGLQRKGFGVPVEVVVERSQPGPVLLRCAAGDGGVQGLRWYSKGLRIDEDGDAADEFLDEVLPETTSNSVHHNAEPMPRLVVKHNTRWVKVKGQVVSSEGKLQQCIEHQGRLLWV